MSILTNCFFSPKFEILSQLKSLKISKNRVTFICNLNFFSLFWMLTFFSIIFYTNASTWTFVLVRLTQKSIQFHQPFACKIPFAKVDLPRECMYSIKPELFLFLTMNVVGGYSLQFYEMSFVVLSRKLSRKYFYFIFEKL